MRRNIFMKKVNGKIVYLNLSGGFYGIESDTGEQLNPVDGLPKAFQKDGLNVQVSYDYSDMFSIHMWGRNINIRDIKMV